MIDNAERAQSQVFRPDKAGNQYIYKKWRVTKGKHTILAAIDAIESVKESNENNNAGLVEINVENKSLSCLSMDSNDDQKLTIVDFRDFSKVYGLKCQNPAAWTQLCSSVDSNNDGSVGIVDFRNFSRFYGKASCK